MSMKLLSGAATLTATSAFALMLVVGPANFAAAQPVIDQTASDVAEDQNAIVGDDNVTESTLTDSQNNNSSNDNNSDNSDNSTNDSNNNNSTNDSNNDNSDNSDNSSNDNNSDNSDNSNNSDNSDNSNNSGADNASVSIAGNGDATYIVSETSLSASVTNNTLDVGEFLHTGDILGGSSNFSTFAGVNSQNLNTGVMSVGQNASTIAVHGQAHIGSN